MKTLIVILLMCFASWHYTNLESQSIMLSVIAPVVFFFSLVALGFWLVLAGGFSGRTDDRTRFGWWSSIDFTDFF